MDAENDTSSPGPGRPLDPEVDRAILAAAGEIFVRDGFQNMTLPGVAAAAGVAKTTVYRRYPSTVELVLATINHLNIDEPRRTRARRATTWSQCSTSPACTSTCRSRARC